jgi:hypothetical protein
MLPLCRVSTVSGVRRLSRVRRVRVSSEEGFGGCERCASKSACMLPLCRVREWSVKRAREGQGKGKRRAREGQEKGKRSDGGVIVVLGPGHEWI